MIKYKTGDLLEASEDIIAHGCNRVGGFGSGVAGQIAKKYPLAKIMYLDKFHNRGWNSGDVQFIPQPDGKIIANCATQNNYLPRGVCHADYKGIKNSMKTLYMFSKPGNLTIAIPKIGSGLAGGEWPIIESIIQDVFYDYDIVVYIK